MKGVEWKDPRDRYEGFRRRAGVIVSLVGIGYCLVYIPINIYRDAVPVALFDVLMAAVLAGNLWYFRRGGSMTVVANIGLGVIVSFIWFAAPYYGETIYYWIFVLPWLGFFLLGARRGLITNSVMLAVIIAMVFVQDPHQGNYVILIDVVGSYALVAVVSFIQEFLRAQSQTQLEKMSGTDELTGVWNRRAGNAAIDVYIHDAAASGEPLSALLLDIDHFKRVNDEYGHLAGDDVLRDVVDIVTRSVRRSDRVIRWGGEEFLVLLPGVDQAQGVALAERIRSAVEAHDFSSVPEAVTVSLGVAQLDTEQPQRWEAWIARADDALYAAKRGGRNQVVSDSSATT